MDQDIHRTPALRGHCRPAYLRRHIFETGIESYRLAQTRSRTEAAAAGKAAG